MRGVWRNQGTLSATVPVADIQAIVALEHAGKPDEARDDDASNHTLNDTDDDVTAVRL